MNEALFINSFFLVFACVYAVAIVVDEDPVPLWLGNYIFFSVLILFFACFVL